MPNSEAGMRSLETLHRTTGYLISHSTVVQRQLRHGKAAMDDPVGSGVVGRIAG